MTQIDPVPIEPADDKTRQASIDALRQERDAYVQRFIDKTDKDLASLAGDPGLSVPTDPRELPGAQSEALDYFSSKDAIDRFEQAGADLAKRVQAVAGDLRTQLNARKSITVPSLVDMATAVTK